MQENGSFDLLFTETTTDTGDLATSGLFNSHADELDPLRLYIYKAIGGMDLDANDDGVLDAVPTPNNGALHGVFLGEQVQQGLFHVSILSELVYQRIFYMLAVNYPLERILMAVDEYTRTLLGQDVDGDGSIDRDDLLGWEPVDGQDDLRRDWADFGEAVGAVRADQPGYLREQALMLTDNALSLVPTPCGGRAVYIQGSIAYVAISDCGVAVVDITDPKRPDLLTIEPTDSPTRDLVVIGTYLYVVAQEDFYTFDVSDPANPDLLDTMEIGDGHRLTRSGNYIYLAESEYGVTVIDVSSVPNDPPLVRGQVETPGDARDVFYANGYVYVADADGLAIVDASDPDDPVVVDNYDTTGDDAEGIAVVGNRAYVGIGGDGLEIVDVTDTAGMFTIGRVPGRDDCADVAVAGGYAYVAAHDAGLMVVNVVNPAAPVLIGHAKLTSTDTRNLAVANGYAYLATDAGLAIIDTASLNAGAFLEPRDFMILGNAPAELAVDVTASGNTAFVVSGEEGMRAIDFSDPYNPSVIDEVDTPEEAVGVTIAGSLVYIADMDDVAVIDVTDPHGCVVKPAIQTPDEANDVVVSGGYAYVADAAPGMGNQFLVIDVGDPDNPALVGEVGLWTDSARGVALSGDPDYVYVAWGYSGLQVVDVSDPEDPAVIGGVQVPDSDDADWCYRVAAYGNHAYVIGEEMYVVDVTSKTSPRYVRTLDRVNEIVFHGTYGYAAARSEGIKVYDMTDPSDPLLFETLPTAYDARGVAVSNGMLLVADGNGGFSVLKSLGAIAVP